MPEPVPAGEWVEIRSVVLQPGERAPQVPDDTARVPLELRCKGFLTAPATLGERVEVRTVTGRSVAGELLRARPAYEHGFGAPVDALLGIGQELRQLLADDEGPA